MPFPWLAAAVAGGAALGVYGQHRANTQNRNSAREQMQFQERMSNTGYQRAMEDARLAGINPMLMAKLGPASTPGGASSTSSNELAGVSNSAMEYALNKASLDKARSEAEIMKSKAVQAPVDAWQDSANKAADYRVLQLQASNLTHSAINQSLQNEVLRAQLPKIMADTKFHSGTGGDVQRWMNLIGQGASTALDLKNLLTPKLGPNFTSSKYFLGSKSTGEIFNP